MLINVYIQKEILFVKASVLWGAPILNCCLVFNSKFYINKIFRLMLHKMNDLSQFLNISQTNFLIIT